MWIVREFVSCTILKSALFFINADKSNMNVAIISCQECFFSNNAEKHVRSFFDKMVTTDRQKLDIM